MLVLSWQWVSSQVEVYQGVGLCMEPQTDKSLANLSCFEFTKDDENDEWLNFKSYLTLE